METPESDWDTRCIFVRPIGDYLGIGWKKDTFERRVECDGDRVDGDSGCFHIMSLDVTCWDVIKFCRLLAKCNPNSIECIYSPKHHKYDLDFHRDVGIGITHYSSPRRLIYGYRGWVASDWKRLKNKEEPKVKLYMACIKGILCGYHAIEFRHGPRPYPLGAFARDAFKFKNRNLFDSRDQEWAIKNLLNRKDWIGTMKRDGAIDQFILKHIDQLEKAAQEAEDDTGLLEKSLDDTLKEVFRRQLIS